MEGLVELFDHTGPVHGSLSDLIEILLHGGGEIEIHDVIEILFQEVIHHGTDIGGEKFPFSNPKFSFTFLLEMFSPFRTI